METQGKVEPRSMRHEMRHEEAFADDHEERGPTKSHLLEHEEGRMKEGILRFA